jgi:hypothetical protein
MSDGQTETLGATVVVIVLLLCLAKGCSYNHEEEMARLGRITTVCAEKSISK